MACTSVQSLATVRYNPKTRRMEAPKQAKKRVAPKVKAALRWYAAGVDPIAIGARMGVTYQTVEKWIRQARKDGRL